MRGVFKLNIYYLCILTNLQIVIFSFVIASMKSLFRILRRNLVNNFNSIGFRFNSNNTRHISSTGILNASYGKYSPDKPRIVCDIRVSNVIT